MSSAETAAQARVPSIRSDPLVFIGIGLVLIVVAGLLYWYESDQLAREEARRRALAAAAEASAESARKAELQRTREREAFLREQQARMAAEEAAERARRAEMMADASTEAQARAQREELTKRQAAAHEAQRSAADREEAWKSFYRPSATCQDPAAAATVECVNAYVKAKREFEARRSGG